MVVGGVGVFVIAIVVLLLFVLPATREGSLPLQAQPAPGGGAPTMPGPPGMPGPGMPGMGGFGMAPPTVPEGVKGDPLEPSRPNPFKPVGVLGIEAIEDFVTPATRYGPVWSRMPITTRVGFPRPERPARPAPPEPPPPTAKKFLRISVIMWSKGVPTASYETAEGKIGSIQPGDWVEEWQVVEIGQDYVVVKNRDTGEIQRVFLKGKE